MIQADVVAPLSLNGAMNGNLNLEDFNSEDLNLEDFSGDVMHNDEVLPVYNS